LISTFQNIFNKRNKSIFIISAIAIIAEIIYSFLQFYYTSLDGDLAGGIISSQDVLLILDNPFGFETVFNNRKYSNPNRFFSHYFFK